VHNLSGQAQSLALDEQPFRSVRLRSRPDTRLRHGRLSMAPYSTAILQ